MKCAYVFVALLASNATATLVQRRAKLLDVVSSAVETQKTSSLAKKSPLASPSALVGTNSINFAYVGCALPGHPLNKLLQTNVQRQPVKFVEKQVDQAHGRALHWALHWGCVQACGPEPVNSMCVTECEVAMYQCIDNAGPGETQADIDKCQGKVLAEITVENGAGAKKEEKEEKSVEKVETKVETKVEKKEEEPKVTTTKPIAEEKSSPAEFGKQVAAEAKATVKKEVEEAKPIVQKDVLSQDGTDQFGRKAVDAVTSILKTGFNHDQEPFGSKVESVVTTAAPAATTTQAAVVKHVGPLPSLKVFMPQCMAHLEQLIAMIDRSYTDTHLQTVLENECMLEKDFPSSCDSGFARHQHCHDFAEQLHEARMLELKTGSVEGYKAACEDYWNLRMHIEDQQAMTIADQGVGVETWFDVFSMPKVCPTMHCIMALSFQYFALYTLLTVVRTLVAFKYNLVGFQCIIETACTTVTYAPMLCVLFLGARMRAIQLTQGETEKYHLPQPWVQSCMMMTSAAVFVQVVLVVLVGFLSGTNNVRTDAEGNLDVSRMPDVSGPGLQVLMVLRYIVMAMLYGGFAAIVAGIFLMQGPTKIWGEQELPVSPAVKCTILLSALFFGIYLLVAVTKTIFELSPRIRTAPFLLKLEASATSAKMTVNFAPMLCILFIGARMRALQIDPKNGNPQSWAQNCFYMCTISVLLQALLVIVMPFLAKGECQRGSVEGDISFSMENPRIGAVLTVVRYLCLAALYGGIGAVVYSVFVIQHPDGPAMTPPVSAAMQCVINLATQYFLIYTLIFVCSTTKSIVSGEGMPAMNDAEQAIAMRFQQPSILGACMTRAIAILDAARATVMFAPMLCILFIGARMRALQLLKSKDGTIPVNAGPQKWVQDGMFLATWAVFVQLIMAMLIPTLTGSTPECDADGNAKVPAGAHKYMALTAEVIRYICLIGMYGGAMVVVVGIFIMTPENLPPSSERNLLPNVAVPRPPLPTTVNLSF